MTTTSCGRSLEPGLASRLRLFGGMAAVYLETPLDAHVYGTIVSVRLLRTRTQAEGHSSMNDSTYQDAVNTALRIAARKAR